MKLPEVTAIVSFNKIMQNSVNLMVHVCLTWIWDLFKFDYLTGGLELEPAFVTQFFSILFI